MIHFNTQKLRVSNTHGRTDHFSGGVTDAKDHHSFHKLKSRENWHVD